MLYQQTQRLLNQLAEQLQAVNLWSQQVPAPAALASSAPFACDTLTFEQWLQFIFIPRMQTLLDSDAQLPSNIALTPMGQHVWQQMPHTAAILAILEQLDGLLSGQ